MSSCLIFSPFSRVATVGGLLLCLCLFAFFAQVGTVLLEQLKGFSIPVVGHVVHPAHLFNGEGIDWAALGLKLRNGLTKTINRGLFLCCRIGAQVGVGITRGRGHCSSPLSSWAGGSVDRKSTRLNSSHQIISYAVFCLKKKKKRMEG